MTNQHKDIIEATNKMISGDKLSAEVDKFYLWALEWRCIEPENACPDCGGCGTKTYGSTACWGGGVGGQMLTSGVCDKCWGSGDITNKWINLRLLRSIPSEQKNKEE